MNMADFAWIVLFLPLLSAVVITLCTQKDARFSAQLSIGAVVTSFVLALAAFISVGQSAGYSKPIESSSFTWLAVGNFVVEFGLRLDPLSLLLMLIVTGVGGAIHIYSYGYMNGDRGFSRYFAGLSMFT